MENDNFQLPSLSEYLQREEENERPRSRAVSVPGTELFSVYGTNVQTQVAKLLKSNSSVRERHDAMETLHCIFITSDSILDDAKRDREFRELLLAQVNCFIDSDLEGHEYALVHRMRFLACHLLSSILRSTRKCKLRIPPLPEVADNAKQTKPNHDINTQLTGTIGPTPHTESSKASTMTTRVDSKRSNKDNHSISQGLSARLRQMAFELNGTQYQITRSLLLQEPNGKRLENPKEWDEPHESKRKLGLIRPRLWYPKAGRKLLEQARSYRRQRKRRAQYKQHLQTPPTENLQESTAITLPPIVKIPNQTVDLSKNSPRIFYQGEMVNAGEVLMTATKRLQEKFDRALYKEGSLERGIFRGIERATDGLPLKFRFEHSVDIEGCNRIIKRLLQQLVENLGLAELRDAWEKWRDRIREEQMIDIVKKAGVARLKGTIAKMMNSRQTRAFETWKIYSAFVYKAYKRRKRMEWIAKRNSAATSIQKFRRGLVEQRAYKIKLTRHYAARTVQCNYRMSVERTKFGIIRNAVIQIQKNARMWSVLAEIRFINRVAVRIQKKFRASLVIHALQDLNYFAVVIQVFVRGAWGYRKAQQRLEEIAALSQLRWTNALKIQRMYRVVIARRKVKVAKDWIASQHRAALKIQQIWYIYKDQYPAFVLMRCLLLQDSVDEYEELLQEREDKNNAALHLQQFHRRLTSMKFASLVRLSRQCSLQIQRLARGFVARKRVRRYKPVWKAATVITTWVKPYLEKCNNMARVIQRAWWSYRPGSLLRHLQVQTANTRTMKKWWSDILQYTAATKIQGMVRRRYSRKRLVYLQSAVSLTRVARGFIHRCIVRHMRADIRRRVATKELEKPFREAVLRATHAVCTRRRRACVMIQCFIRCYRARRVFKVKYMSFQAQVAAAVKIQTMVRRVFAIRLLRKLQARESRRKVNRYRRENNLWNVLCKAPTHSRGYYCPYDPAAGAHPAEWLHRLGLQYLWRDFKLHKMNTVDKILLCNDKLLQRVGVHLSSERRIILDAAIGTKVFSNIVLKFDSDLTKVSYRCMDSLISQAGEELLQKSLFGALEVFDRTMSLSSLQVNFEQLFLMVFPNQELRAKAVGTKLGSLGFITSLQLDHFFSQYNASAKQAKENIDNEFNLVCEPVEVLEQWNQKRFKRCYTIYEMALERIRDILPLDCWVRHDIEKLHDMASHESLHGKKQGCNMLRAGIEHVRLVWVAITVLQRWRRGMLARARVRQLQANRLLLKLHRVYKEEVSGGLVRRRHAADRHAEQEEYRLYLEDLRRHAIEAELSGVPRYGWESRYDEYYSAYYFEKVTEPGIGETDWEMPQYSEEERESVLAIQTAMRVKLGKNTAQRMRNAIEKLRLKNLEMDMWLARAPERRNFVTIRFKVGELNETEVEGATLPGNAYSWQSNYCKSVSMPWETKEQEETLKTQPPDRPSSRGSTRSRTPSKAESPTRLKTRRRHSRKQHTRRQRLLRRKGDKVLESGPGAVVVSRLVSEVVKERKEVLDELIQQRDGIAERIQEVDNEVSIIVEREKAVLRIQQGEQVNAAWVQYMSKPLPQSGLIRIQDAELKIPNLTNSTIESDWNVAYTGDGFPYYFHKETMETTWEKPEAVVELETKIEISAQRLERKQMTLCDKRVVQQETELSLMFEEELAQRVYQRQFEARRVCGHLFSLGFRLPHHSEDFVQKGLEVERSAGLVLTRVSRGFLGRSKLNIHRCEKRKRILESQLALINTEIDIAANHVLSSYVTMECKFDQTYVEVPWGWSIVSDGYGRNYYYHGETGQTSWVAPEYTWEEEFAARNLQRVTRGMLGRVQFKAKVNSFRLGDMIEAGLEGYKSRGCFGRGVEGLSVEMWFARMGLHFLLPPVKKKSAATRNRRKLVELFLPWTEKSLAEVGFTTSKQSNETKVGIDDTGFGDSGNPESIIGISQTLEILKNAQKFMDKDPRLEGNMALELVKDTKFAAEAFRKMFPSQTARADKFALELASSPTPYSHVQVVRHIFKYQGKASFAISQIGAEVASKPVISGLNDLDSLYFAMRAPLARLCVVVGNMQLPTLRARLKEVLQVADHVYQLGKLEQENIDAAEKKKRANDTPTSPKSPTAMKLQKDKALKSPSKLLSSPTNRQQFQETIDGDPELVGDQSSSIDSVKLWGRTLFAGWACAHPIGPPGTCYVIREGFEHLLHWQSATEKIQRTYRSKLALRQWRIAVSQWHEAALYIECFWRCCVARSITAGFRSQFQADWQEYWDEDHGRNFFHNSATGEAQWHRPKDEPYRPLGWWPPDESHIPVPPGMCFVCRVEEAKLVCNDCWTGPSPGALLSPDANESELPRGERKRYCFSCYATVHDRSRALALHQHESLINPEKPMGCVLCQFEARRRCLECEDNFCLACYRRVHGKGSRKSHHWLAFRSGALACSECEELLATKRCHKCRDVYCDDCFRVMHQKGRRKGHTFEVIEEEVKEGQGR